MKSAEAADPAVAEFLRRLEHPLKSEIEALRRVLLAADPAVREGIKWNAPSFHTHGDFATFHLRRPDRVQLVLHRGAKARSGAAKVHIDDPTGLLEWRSSDRCLVTFGPDRTVASAREALQNVLRQWIAQLP